MDRNEMSLNKYSIDSCTDRKRKDFIANHNRKRFSETDLSFKPKISIIPENTKYKVINTVLLKLLN